MCTGLCRRCGACRGAGGLSPCPPAFRKCTSPHWLCWESLHFPSRDKPGIQVSHRGTFPTACQKRGLWGAASPPCSQNSRNTLTGLPSAGPLLSEDPPQGTTPSLGSGKGEKGEGFPGVQGPTLPLSFPGKACPWVQPARVGFCNQSKRGRDRSQKLWTQQMRSPSSQSVPQLLSQPRPELEAISLFYMNFDIFRIGPASVS